VPLDESSLRLLWRNTLSIPGAVDPGATYGKTTRAEQTLPGSAAMRNLAHGAAGFDFVNEIGRGGMGVVFRATQSSLRRDVAIKQVRPDTIGEDARAEFVAEALVNALLTHPNIVPVYDLTKSPDGEILLAMKLVKGASWKALLHPKSDEDRTLAAAYDQAAHLGILLSVSNAVAFAHSRGIVHRDLKPENVMVGDFGEILVMDWGLAVDVRDKPTDPRTIHKSKVHSPAGSPSYMAPELAEGRGRDIGPWTDIYLLGSTLHEIVTGHAPHRGKSVYDVISSAVISLPPQFPPETPEELATICRTAMAREPRDRYASVAEFQTAVKNYLKHTQSTAISSSASRTLARCEAAIKSGNVPDRHRLYGDFAEAVAGFKQARMLWLGNVEAWEGERRARVAYGNAALASGDFGLAEAQAVGLENGDELRAKVKDAQQSRDRAARNAMLTRRLLAVAAILIIVGMGVGYALVAKSQREAFRQRDIAQGETKRAEGETQRAGTERQRAEQETLKAERARIAAQLAADEAKAERAKAVKALAHVLTVRARQAADAGDHAAALVLFAESNFMAPSLLARANANWFLGRVPKLAAVDDAGGAVTAITYEGGKATSFTIGKMKLDDREYVGAISRDGKFVVTEQSTDTPKTVRLGVRRTSDGSLIGRVDASTMSCATFSQDGSIVMAVATDDSIRAWRTSDLRPISQLVRISSGTFVTSICMSPDNKTAYAFASGALYKINVATQDPTLLWQTKEASIVMHRMEVAPGGRFLAAAVGKTATLFNIETGKFLFRGADHHDYVDGWAFAEGTWATCSRDGTVRMWTFPETQPTGVVLKVEGGALAVAVSPDGTELAAGGGRGTLYRWTLAQADGREIRDVPAANRLQWVHRVHRVLVGSSDKSVRIYNDQNGELVATLPMDDMYFDLEASEDGRLAVAGASLLIAFDPSNGRRIGKPLRTPGRAIFYLRDDGWVALLGDKAQLWNPATGELKNDEGGSSMTAADGGRITWFGTTIEFTGKKGDTAKATLPAKIIAVSPAKEVIACLFEGNRLRLLRFPDLAAIGGDLDVPAMEWLRLSDDGRRLIGYAGLKSVWSLDRDSGKALALPPPGERLGQSPYFSADLRRAVVLEGGKRRFWDLSTGQAYGDSMPGEEFGSNRFTPDGTGFLTTTQNSARLYDVRTGKPSWEAIIFEGKPDDIDFLGDGSIVMILSRGEGAHFFDVATGQRVGAVLLSAQMGVGLTTNSILNEADGELLIWHSSMMTPATIRIRPIGKLFEAVDAGELRKAAQKATGLKLNERGEVEAMTTEEWKK